MIFPSPKILIIIIKDKIYNDWRLMVNILSETQKTSLPLDENAAGRIWQIVVGLILFVIATVISLIEIVSQSRKYKKVSIPIEN
jgi:hypothetical protein